MQEGPFMDVKKLQEVPVPPPEPPAAQLAVPAAQSTFTPPLPTASQIAAPEANHALLEWIQGHGGSCTARDLQRSNANRYPLGADAQAALQALVIQGHGTCEAPADSCSQPDRPVAMLAVFQVPMALSNRPDRS
jgi:hypothetical protein